MSKSRIPDSLRSVIAAQFDFRGAYCQTQQQISGVRLTVDHIVPEALGGTTEKQNLCLACWDCNLHKAARSLEFLPINRRVNSLRGILVVANSPN